MFIVDTALKKRAEDGNPIRVGLVGAGFQGTAIAVQIMSATPGMELAAIASRRLEPARQAYASCGLTPVVSESRADIETNIAAGRPVITEDAIAMAGAEGLDAIIEVTGSLDHAARAIIAGIEHGKHVIQMNAELDGTVGPILKKKADAAGVIYTFADGDQPGVEMNLYRFARTIGMEPRLCGNIKGLQDPYRNPSTQVEYAKKWGQKPAMVASFADGTKISFEQAVVANGTGMRVAKRGMIGPDFSGGDPSAPLVPLEEAVHAFDDKIDRDGPGIVDYIVGARPGPGVFVLGTMEGERRRWFLNLYKMGAGPYYCLYTPYHLCHFEVPISVARAVLFGDSVLAPAGGPLVGVIATAKKDLKPGEIIESYGGYEVYGVAENQDVIRREHLLPIGLSIGCKVVREVSRDTALTFDDVDIPPGRLVDELYGEQERVFASADMAVGAR